MACAIERGDSDLGLYTLEAYVVMPNHVHMLINPKDVVAKITQRVKGRTALAANHMLGRMGRPFWQDESFDRWVRNEGERERLHQYIENNPVIAGLVKIPNNWLWSSAGKRKTTG
ncbi:MAG: transposase [Candidatus Acidiferrales bacterium]